MATKYHINDRGEPGICNAVHKCRFGRDADQHYDSVDEARTAYEKEKVNELFPNGVEKDKLGRRELNKLVKYTDDQEILRQGIDSGSARIRASILQNRNADAETLTKLYETVEEGTGADAERQEIVSHRNYPASGMTDQEFKKALRSRTLLSFDHRKQLLSDDGVNDNHKETLNNLDANEALTAAANKNNQLSQSVRKELLNKDSQTRILALKNGALPAEEVRNLDASEFKNLSYSADRMTNPRHVDEIAAAALKNKHGDDISEIALEKVSRNPYLSQMGISAIAKANVNEKFKNKYNDIDVSLYRLPNIDDDTKKLLEKRSPEIASIAKVDKIITKAGGSTQLKDKIVKESNESQAGNAYRKTRVVFDKDEMKKLGMGKDEVLTLMNRRAWNADFSYDEETGVFVGGIDSSG